MLPISIVILTKNEARNIARCLTPLTELSDDILVVDSGSEDDTAHIAANMGAKVIRVNWKGYAQTKNDANALAKYDWILSLDADEEVGTELSSALQELFASHVPDNKAYLLRRKMVYCGAKLQYGATAKEYRLRLFNRKNAKWNENAVHEDIIFTTDVDVKKLPGFMWHHSFRTHEEHLQKIEHYARLFAQQKLKEGSSVSFLKSLSPYFGFFKNYILKSGWLDGWKGLQYAKTEMKYTARKYALIRKGDQAFLGKS